MISPCFVAKILGETMQFNMNRTIVVTDLTRFSNRDIVCMAGIDIQNGECIRPMPYLKASLCEKWNLLPGAVLSGNFNVVQNIENPHVEDMSCPNLQLQRFCSIEEFRNILFQSSSQSIEHGFNVQLDLGQKYIPIELTPLKSLITILVNPSTVRIVQDNYGKIKIHFTDNNSKEYTFLAITDLGFHSYAENHYKEVNSYDKINSVIQNQTEVFLRIGLSRLYQNQQGKEGFWIQVNGIYSFPNYFKDVRKYGYGE